MPELTMERISENIIDFRESGVDAYLIIGTQRALLIDSLMNEVGLVDAIKKVTDKPVDVLITHGHGDHAGAEVKNLVAAGMKVYMDGRDWDVLTGMFGETQFKKEWFAPVSEGNVFDLGDQKYEVISVPGHTIGSLVAFDRSAGIMFTGDSLGSGEFWMQIPGAQPLVVLQESINHLIEKVDADRPFLIYPGHREQAREQFTDEYMIDCKTITDKLVSGEWVGEDCTIERGDMVMHCKTIAYRNLYLYRFMAENIR